jgi:hypothetical protein
VRIVCPQGEFAAKRGDGGAWAAEPPGAAIDDDAMEAVLLEVANLRAGRVLDLSLEDPGRFGLTRPLARIELGLTGENGVRKAVLVGSPFGPGESYAMLQGKDTLFTLREETIRGLIAPVGGTAAPREGP